MRPFHHHLIEVSLSELRPTQAAIGFEEVTIKRQEWQSLSRPNFKKIINQHWFPGVIGPGGTYYIVDHHHLGMALHLEACSKVKLTVLQDFSWLDQDSFWKLLEFHQWVHPYDEKGKRISFQKIPTQISELKDDPYRSLAGIARRSGAFAKDITPFSEFLWADFYRLRIDKSVLKSSPSHALELAHQLAKLRHASYLPGWIGESNPNTDRDD